jgi:hypothetical protein
LATIDWSYGVVQAVPSSYQPVEKRRFGLAVRKDGVTAVTFLAIDLGK